MTDNNELTRNDINLEPDNIEIEDENWICFYIQAWFDVDKKFNINIMDDDDSWLDMKAKYNPYSEELVVICIIS